MLLGLDVGTTKTKAVLIDAGGDDAGHAEQPTPFVTSDGRVEMEVDDLLRCLRDVLGDLGDARRQAAGVGIAGMAESGAPLDRSGRPLAPVIAWHDQRGDEAVAALERHFGTDLSRRIGQPVRTVLTVAKLGWLVEHGAGEMVRWLGVPELGLHALTGIEATEFSLAARTGSYDVAARRWLPEVADVLGFPRGLFADIAPAGAPMGRVTPEGATWSGLPAGTPVTIGGHDHLAGMAGAGVPRGWVANSVGTAETLVARVAAVPDLAAALDRRVAVTVFPGGEEWAALVSGARAGVVLQAAAEVLGCPLDELDRLAEDAEPADVGDAVDRLAQGKEASLPPGSPGETWAGLLQALAARAAEGYERLAALVGPAEGIVVFGGGSVSDPWLSAKTAALPVPVRRSSVMSAVARGAAIHAGVAASWWPSADAAPTPQPPNRG